MYSDPVLRRSSVAGTGTVAGEANRRRIPSWKDMDKNSELGKGTTFRIELKKESEHEKTRKRQIIRE